MKRRRFSSSASSSSSDATKKQRQEPVAIQQHNSECGCETCLLKKKVAALEEKLQRCEQFQQSWFDGDRARCMVCSVGPVFTKCVGLSARPLCRACLRQHIYTNAAQVVVDRTPFVRLQHKPVKCPCSFHMLVSTSEKFELDSDLRVDSDLREQYLFFASEQKQEEEALVSCMHCDSSMLPTLYQTHECSALHITCGFCSSSVEPKAIRHHIMHECTQIVCPCCINPTAQNVSAETIQTFGLMPDIAGFKGTFKQLADHTEAHNDSFIGYCGMQAGTKLLLWLIANGAMQHGTRDSAPEFFSFLSLSHTITTVLQQFTRRFVCTISSNGHHIPNYFNPHGIRTEIPNGIKNLMYRVLDYSPSSQTTNHYTFSDLLSQLAETIDMDDCLKIETSEQLNLLNLIAPPTNNNDEDLQTPPRTRRTNLAPPPVAHRH